jgi:DNA-binding CsgD family transcriptional regulator/tetratricopeptide (TPR) repeat protein
VAVLEREGLLATLDARLGEAARGAGSLLAIGGEAGVGKSTLVRSFCDAHRGRAVVAWGACDAMATARPLGPLHDIARLIGGRLAEVTGGDADRHSVFTAFLDVLCPPRAPVIVVFEDVHWADEATLDLLVFLGRRVAQCRALVLATFRDDEVGPGHPLRVVLGNLATTPAVHRLGVPPLSRAAVRELAADADVDGDRLFDVTGGNAFFVTEVLAVGASASAVPSSVSDAVVARVARLSAPARRALDSAAVVPDRVDVALLRDVGDVSEEAVDECQAAGILVQDEMGLRFRHELARLAVEQAQPAGRRASVHARVLAHLAARPGTGADRLAHHAERAGDADGVLRYAERAAQRAAGLGAHREAAAQYARMLRFADGLTPRRRAEILERFADECRATDQIPEAVEASALALAVWEELGDVQRQGAVMARRAMYLWSAGRNDEAYRDAEEAVRLLEAHPGPGLATAFTFHAYLRMLARDIDAAIDYGNRAVRLVEEHQPPGLLARALNAVGSAMWFVDPDQAQVMLERSLAVAKDSDTDDVAAAALCNLGSGSGEVRLYATAERWLRETVTWCEERDLDTNHMYGLAWLSRVLFERGQWPAALSAATRVTASDPGYVPTRIVALTVLGRLRARRGDPDPAALLEQAWDLAIRTGDLQRTWPVAAGRAEAACLAGAVDAIPGLVADTYDDAVRLGHGWAIGELGYWLWRAGGLDAVPADAAEPFALQTRGRSQAAAAEWRRLGCPYEAAVALAESDRLEALNEAYAEFSRLGAWPAADQVARRLRERGERRLPRRPRRATMDNPARLTGRELEVLRLISADLRNADIAARLHISTKTVDHHVSAILTKLGVSTRRDASRVGRGLLSKDGEAAGTT